jgi:hypothetical protein
MAVKTQDAAGYYVWEIAGKPVTVHLHLDVVDHLLAVVLRGLGALPKRGAEVGGLLIGTIEQGDVSIVRIEDFEPVECEYTLGPSYLFTEADRGAFEAACARWQPSDTRPAYAVGFYRSHTREGMSLTPEDLQLVDKHFAAPSNIVLLIKPFRAKMSMGGFFFREAGAFPQKTPLEFPFRRSDLAGEETPPPAENGTAPRQEEVLAPVTIPKSTAIAAVPAFASIPAQKEPLERRKIRNALWIPLSFIFLVVGLAIGLTLASTRGAGRVRPGISEVSLGLSVSQADNNLNVKWDRQSAAIRQAQRGTIEIEDGGETVSRSLDAIELQNGSLIYRNASNLVKFRLIVYPGERVSVVETAEWKR